VFMLVHTDPDDSTAADVHRLPGVVRQSAVVTLLDGTTLEGRLLRETDTSVDLETVQAGVATTTTLLRDRIRHIDRGQFSVQWGTIASERRPAARDEGVYVDYVGAYLTGHAFDRVAPGLGRWLVTLAAWLFAVSTIISWSYYGEQGIIYLAGPRAVLAYKLIYCLLIIVATAGFVTRDEELDNLTGLGTAVMLFANVPIMLIFGRQAMAAYHDYIGRLASGRMEGPHAAPPLVDVVEGRDV
jgi:hypothetical protein